MEIGGGFGGKIRIYCEPLAAMLAKKAGKPVKMTMTREEVFEATGPTSGTYIRVKIGAKKDGTIVAAAALAGLRGGRVPGLARRRRHERRVRPVRHPERACRWLRRRREPPENAAYRAPGAPAPTFAVESLIDELAERLDMDPMDLRIKNAVDEGTRRAERHGARRHRQRAR